MRRNARLGFLLGVGITAAAFLLFAAGLAGIGISANGVGLGTVEDVHFNAQSPIVLAGSATDEAATLHFSLDPAFSAGSGNVPPGGTDGEVLTRQGATGFDWETDNHIASGTYSNGVLSLLTTAGDNVEVLGIPRPDGVVTSATLSGNTLTLNRSAGLSPITATGFTSGGGADGVANTFTFTAPNTLTIGRSVGAALPVTLPLWLDSVATGAGISGNGTSADPLIGFTQANADARVQAGVADWAEFGNTERIPGTKMSFGYGYVGAAQGSLIVVQTSNVNISIINSGYTSDPPGFPESFSVPTRSGQQHALVAILNSLVPNRADYAVMWGDGSHSPPLDEWTRVTGNVVPVAARAFTYYMLTLPQVPGGVARLQHLIQIDSDLLPEASATQSGVITPTDYARIGTGSGGLQASDITGAPTLTEAQLADNDDFILHDTSATGNGIARITASQMDRRWVDRDDPTYVDLTESFVGGTWTTSSENLIAQGVPPSSLPTTPESLTYGVTFPSGPRYTNVYIIVRIPLADKNLDGAWRLFEDEFENPDYFYQRSWRFIKDAGAYAYYGVPIADKPVARYDMQELDPYMLNESKVDTSCILQAQKIYVFTKAAATAFTSAEFLSANAVDIDCGQQLRTSSYTGGGQRRIGIAIPADQDLYFTTIDQDVGTFGEQSGGAIPISGANYDVWTSPALNASDVPMLIIVGDE